MRNVSTGREGMVPTAYIKQEEKDNTTNDTVEPKSAEVQCTCKNLRISKYTTLIDFCTCACRLHVLCVGHSIPFPICRC